MQQTRESTELLLCWGSFALGSAVDVVMRDPVARWRSHVSPIYDLLFRHSCTYSYSLVNDTEGVPYGHYFSPWILIIAQSGRVRVAYTYFPCPGCLFQVKSWQALLCNEHLWSPLTPVQPILRYIDHHEYTSSFIFVNTSIVPAACSTCPSNHPLAAFRAPDIEQPHNNNRVI